VADKQKYLTAVAGLMGSVINDTELRYWGEATQAAG